MPYNGGCVLIVILILLCQQRRVFICTLCAYCSTNKSSCMPVLSRWPVAALRTTYVIWAIFRKHNPWKRGGRKKKCPSIRFQSFYNWKCDLRCNQWLLPQTMVRDLRMSAPLWPRHWYENRLRFTQSGPALEPVIGAIRISKR